MVSFWFAVFLTLYETSLRHCTIVYGPFHGDESLGLNPLGVTEFCNQKLSPGLYRGTSDLELYESSRRSWAAWRWKACCFVSSLHVNTFLLNKLMHITLVGLFWQRVLNINGEVNFVAKNKILGCVTCRFMHWSSKCHNHIRKLLSPIALEVIDGFGQHNQ